MPFQKGKATKGAGRRGYEIEEAQLKKMQRALDRDLELLDRLQTKIDKGEPISNDEKELMQLTASRISKYLDKLHATKEHKEVSGSIEHTVEPESLEKIKKAIEEL